MTQKKVLRKSRTHLKSSNRKILCTDFLGQLLHADDQNTIMLSSSRAFLQCLCEACTNPMLKVGKLNHYLSAKIKHVDHLVDETLCKDQEFNRQCSDRKCSSCGAEQVLGRWKGELQDKLRTGVTWLRWQKTAQSRKTQAEKKGCLSEMLDEPREEMKNLALHLKTKLLGGNASNTNCSLPIYQLDMPLSLSTTQKIIFVVIKMRFRVLIGTINKWACTHAS